ncbi:MAG: transposase, partial [Tannerellaceae bacterium]|nr:transposase [Tannerellaceae bacterium]
MAWHKGFHGWFTAGKNSFYRLLCREKIHWRKLLLGVGKGFLRIVREQGGEGAGSPRCFILDDTTFEKTGMHLEGISRVFDHVKHCCVLGYKCLILVFFDGKSSIPVDFSLHAEAGSKGTYGLSAKERSACFSKSRADGSPAKLRKSELGKSKTDVSIEMFKRAWKQGFRASCVLMDSWFTCKEMISEIRRTGKGCLDCVGLVKAGNTRYKVDGRMLAAQEIILRRERRQQKFCRKYKCAYITVNTFLGTTPVRLFLIRYG